MKSSKGVLILALAAAVVCVRATIGAAEEPQSINQNKIAPVAATAVASQLARGHDGFPGGAASMGGRAGGDGWGAARADRYVADGRGVRTAGSTTGFVSHSVGMTYHTGQTEARQISETEQIEPVDSNAQPPAPFAPAKTAAQECDRRHNRQCDDLAPARRLKHQ